jgi:hypothetical protein
MFGIVVCSFSGLARKSLKPDLGYRVLIMTAEASQVKISDDLSGLSQVLKIRPESALRIFSRPENHTPHNISTWTDAESAAAIRVAIISWGEIRPWD